MIVLKIITIIMLAYLIGSIPYGLIFVKILKGHDIRNIESGRTGGTNAGRAAGIGAGVLTGVMDFFKSFIAVMIAKTIFPDQPWIEISAALFAILGHNYSVFLLERQGPGKYTLRGGAGGAPCMGGSFAFYPLSLFIILPATILILFGIGYASIANAFHRFPGHHIVYSEGNHCRIQLGVCRVWNPCQTAADRRSHSKYQTLAQWE